MNICAVIDIGSNSARMTVYDFTGEMPAEIQNIRQYVRLSENMQADNMLKAAAINRTVDALVKMKEVANESGADSIYCVATEAVRRAENADVFLSAVKEKTGIDIKVLSGEREAEVGFKAVMREVTGDDTVIIDVGGGSAEFTLVIEKELVNSASLRLGAVVLTEQFKNKNHDEMYKFVYEKISQLEFLKSAKGVQVTALGGTASTITRVFGDRKINREKIDNLYMRLKSIPPEKRTEVAGIEPERADIILAGVTVYKVLFDILESNMLYYSYSNIRDGIAYELFDRRWNNEL